MAVEIATLLTLTRALFRCSLTAVSADSGATLPANGVPGSAGAILELVRTGRATTRGDLVSLTGLARSTVAQRIDALLANRLLVSGGDSASTGGRPPATLEFNSEAGVVLAGDIGAMHSRVAVTDLAGRVLSQRTEEIPVAEGPERVLSWLEGEFDSLLAEAGQDADRVRGVGVGLPGPVEFATGRPVTPPIMPGWNLYPVGERLAERFGVLALVDNDVNIMAVGEHWSRWRDKAFLMFVKVGTGIGCGLVAGGHVHRGADGAAGDIGPAIRDVMQEIDRDVAVYDVRSMAAHLDNGSAFMPFRLGAFMTTLFGGMGMLLASIGLYGMIAYHVGQRTQEIGVRMALGARAGDIMRDVLWQGGRFAAIGIAAGVVLSAGLAQLLKGLLLGVSPFDPLSYAGVTALLVAICLMASFVPARRATTVDPLVALRAD